MAMRKCLQVLEIVIGFLSSTGGTHVKQLPGDVLIRTYLEETLLMKEQAFGDTTIGIIKFSPFLIMFREASSVVPCGVPVETP